MRSDAGQQGLALIVDARGTSPSVLHTVLTTVYAVEDISSYAIDIVHILTDRTAQALLFRSSIFRPSSKINTVTDLHTLQKFIATSSLPTHLGGSFSLTHQQWLTFRRVS